VAAAPAVAAACLSGIAMLASGRGGALPMLLAVWLPAAHAACLAAGSVLWGVVAAAGSLSCGRRPRPAARTGGPRGGRGTLGRAGTTTPPSGRAGTAPTRTRTPGGASPAVPAPQASRPLRRAARPDLGPSTTPGRLPSSRCSRTAQTAAARVSASAQAAGLGGKAEGRFPELPWLEAAAPLALLLALAGTGLGCCRLRYTAGLDSFRDGDSCSDLVRPGVAAGAVVGAACAVAVLVWAGAADVGGAGSALLGTAVALGALSAVCAARCLQLASGDTSVACWAARPLLVCTAALCYGGRSLAWSVGFACSGWGLLMAAFVAAALWPAIVLDAGDRAALPAAVLPIVVGLGVASVFAAGGALAGKRRKAGSR